MLIFVGDGNTSNTLGVSDTAGNTWTPILAATNLGTVRCATWYAISNTSSATTVTITGTPTAAFLTGLFDEFSGQAASPIDNNTSTSGSGTPTVSLTPVANNCALWNACSDTITGVGTSPLAYNKGADDGFQDWSEYFILSGGGGSAQTCNFVGSGAFAITATSIAPLVASTAHLLSCTGAGR